jgi:hypothetical protein
MIPPSFPVRNRGGKSERTMAYLDFRDFGHAISRLPSGSVLKKIKIDGNAMAKMKRYRSSSVLHE